MFITFRRIIKTGWQTFLRNSLLSASSILIMTITMSIIASLFFASLIIESSIAQLEKKVDINVYFKEDANPVKVLEFTKLIKKLPEVDLENSILLTKLEALGRFKNRSKGNEVMETALQILDENPLGQTFNVVAKRVGDYKIIMRYIESNRVNKKYGDLINNLNYREIKEGIEKLHTLISYTYKIGIIISLVLILISIIVTFNTTRLIIYTFKEEISVMRLVGASKFFARGPFIVEGIIYGIISAIFTLFLTWTVIIYISPTLNEIFILNLNQYFSDHILDIATYLVSGGFILGFISSYLAVSKYIKI